MKGASILRVELQTVVTESDHINFHAGLADALAAGLLAAFGRSGFPAAAVARTAVRAAAATAAAGVTFGGGSRAVTAVTAVTLEAAAMGG